MRSVAALIAISASLVAGASAAALQVPILVEQVLPEGVPGFPVPGEPVSAGIPFAVEDGITDIRSLGMTGTRAAQFRVLQRDPETGRVTWVLATFLADGGPYALTTGSGSFGGGVLASDAGDRIVVSTGPAQFEVRKRGFDLLDRVVVGGSEIVAPHTDGGVVLASGGTRWDSGSDSGSEVVIEDNGPVMAVVRARGVLRSAAGAPALPYTVRLYFYRGASFCRAFVTLRNADLASPSAKTFDAAWVEMPLRLASDREVRFGFPGTGFADRIGAGGTAHLFQGDNTFERSPRTTAILPALCPSVGLEVEIGGQVHNTLGVAGDVARGWVRVQDSKLAVLAGMRDMAALFPSGFDIRADRLAVEMFSRHNPRPGLVFSWGAHETRELLFEFGTAGLDPERFRARLQYPLLGRCEFERYRSTGAHCGERRLVTAGEESSFFAALGKRWAVARYGEGDIRFERQYSFGTTGGGNQFDQDECHLLDFLRSGSGGRFQQGRLGALWKADQAVLHSDDFDYATHRNGVNDLQIQQPAGFHGKGAGSLFDDEHPHWVSLILYYHLTGDEHVREAIEDYGEWRQYRAGNPTFGALWGGGVQHFRLWSRCLRDVALLYEFTGQERYLEHTRRMAGILTGTIERGTSRGRNLDRGYFYFGDENDSRRLIHLFFLTEMNAIGVQEAMRVLPGSDPLKEELRDYLLGLAWFTLQEAQVDPGAIGYPYEYLAAAPNQPGVRGDQTGLLLTHGYEMSGDPEFVRRSRQLAWHVPEYQHWLRASELGTQLRIYRWLHRDEVGAGLVQPRAARNTDGSYTLRWVAPAGASAYIVKAGPRPLVENLGFDPVRRSFRIDPALAMNFWAAKNFAGEPVPGAAGANETFRTPPLPAGTWYFAVKVLGDRPLGGVGPGGMPVGEVRRPGGARSGDPVGPGKTTVSGTASQSRVLAVQPQLVVGRAAGSGVDARGRVRVVARTDAEGVVFEGLSPSTTLRLYDVAGRLVREMTGGDSGTVVWDRRAASGGRVAAQVLLYRVDAADGNERRGRLVLAP